nr:glycosyltransferase family 2 protein [Ramlibacter agri]
MTVFKPVVVIPVYNHPDTIPAVCAAVRAHGLECILVDDGSDGRTQAAVQRLAVHDLGVHRLRLATNQGKGAAMVAGFREAARRGFTHVLQVDADGQHDTGDIPQFIEQARLHPDAVIAGCPVYDASVPKGRLYGRYATHVWVWINTLSLDIRDSMCGFRAYPLASLMPLLEKVRIGRRMDFDSDVIVRLHWRGVPVVNLATRVTYPQDGISHFRMLRDNVRISAMHTRLFFGMLARLPMLLWRKVAA